MITIRPSRGCIRGSLSGHLVRLCPTGNRKDGRSRFQTIPSGWSRSRTGLRRDVTIRIFPFCNCDYLWLVHAYSRKLIRQELRSSIPSQNSTRNGEFSALENNQSPGLKLVRQGFIRAQASKRNACLLCGKSCSKHMARAGFPITRLSLPRAAPEILEYILDS